LPNVWLAFALGNGSTLRVPAFAIPSAESEKRCRDLLSISTGSQEALPMGERSGFERREADFGPTPRAAVVPLIPRLRCIRSFAEPCAVQIALFVFIRF